MRQSVRLTVRSNSAELKIGTTNNGNVSRGQVVRVARSMTHNAADWFWVAAVNGDETLKGWVTASAVVKSDADSSPAAAKVSPQPSHPVSNDMAAQARPVQSTYPSQTGTPYSTQQSYSPQAGNRYTQPCDPLSQQLSTTTQQSVPGGQSMARGQRRRHVPQQLRSGTAEFRRKSIWATPQWESPAQIRQGIANGTLKW